MRLRILIESAEWLTLENLEVCAVTAEKGVCSGSTESMVASWRRRSPEKTVERKQCWPYRLYIQDIVGDVASGDAVKAGLSRSG